MREARAGPGCWATGLGEAAASGTAVRAVTDGPAFAIASLPAAAEAFPRDPVAPMEGTAARSAPLSTWDGRSREDWLIVDGASGGGPSDKARTGIGGVNARSVVAAWGRAAMAAGAAASILGVAAVDTDPRAAEDAVSADVVIAPEG